MQSKNFCYRKPEFPKKAYVLGLWFASRDGQPMPYFYMPIFSSFDDVLSHVAQAFKDLKGDGIDVLSEILILPLTLNELYPLKPEFWQEPSVKYDEWTRWELMLKATRFYKLHKLIVTSSFFKESEEIFAAALPFPSASPNDIEAFMRASDFPVDQSSKFAAIYSIEEPIGFNTLTNQIIKQEDEKIDLAIN